MEYDHQTQFGASLPVPSVQELAKQKPAAVPIRYIRQDLQSPPETKPCSSTHVPIIDLQKLMSEEEQSTHDSELRKLHFACKDWGFFQVTKLIHVIFNLKTMVIQKRIECGAADKPWGELFTCGESKS